MARFLSSPGTYADAIALIRSLNQAGIESSITTGGVSIQCNPDQVNTARAICQTKGASFDGGYTSTESDFLARTVDGYEHLKVVTGDAIAVIKEWKEHEKTQQISGLSADKIHLGGRSEDGNNKPCHS